MCRRSGLEQGRRCGWLKLTWNDTGRLVWAKGTVGLQTCPKSYITAESLCLVEEFFVRRRLRVANSDELSARQVEAFLLLEKALGTEMNHGQHNTKRAL